MMLLKRLFGKGRDHRCKNCFYNVIIPDREDRFLRIISEKDRVCRNFATARRAVSYGAKYPKSLYKCGRFAGWNCPHWIKRSPNQPEVK
jgi:hypothetical protein